MSFVPLAISTLAIVLLAGGAVIAIALVLGFLGVRARARHQAGSWAENVAEADSALAQARASDRGWERSAMEQAARSALEQQRPGWPYGVLHLVLVDDRPGIEEDSAHFVAVGDGGDEARVVLRREGDRWSAESVD
jgi:Flp pilus assembly protein TadB